MFGWADRLIMRCLSPWWSAQAQLYSLRSGQQEVRPGYGFVFQVEHGEVKHRFDQDFCLQPQEPGTQARVDAEAQADLLVDVLAGDVHAFRVAEDGRIVVRGREHDPDGGAGRDRNAADLRIHQRYAVDGVDRVAVPEELLGRPGDQRGIVPEALLLIGVADERDDGVAHQVGRRLVPGEQQQNEHGDEFVPGQPLTVLLGVDEHGEQVRTWFTTTAVDQRGHVVPERLHRLVGPVEVGVGGADGQRDLVRPAPDQLRVLLWRPEHRRYHQERKREGCLLHQFHAAPLTSRTKQLLDQVLDHASHVSDPPPGEGQVGQA